MKLSWKNWFPKKSQKIVKPYPNKETECIGVVTTSFKEFEEFCRQNKFFSKELNVRYFQISDHRSYRGYKFDHMIFVYGWSEVHPTIINECLSRVKFNKDQAKKKSERWISITSLLTAVAIAGVVWAFVFYIFIELMIKIKLG